MDPRDDEHCIATMKHYRNLVPLALDARKPIFSLSAGDGALGSHAAAARDAFSDFRALAENLLLRTRAPSVTSQDGSAAPPDHVRAGSGGGSVKR